MAGKKTDTRTTAPRGRPTDYRAEYAAQARRLCLLGATDREMAEFFEVSEQTVNAWKKAHPEFLESLKKGKALADGKVAERLYQRACGFIAPETDIRVIEGQIVKTEVQKHYPPDTTAAIFWLKNRQRDKWRDKVDHGIEGANGGPIQVAAYTAADYAAAQAKLPADYGEQVHRVGARFAILEAALLLGGVVTGWNEQSCRDAVQHAYNTWVMEFGTGNREHLQAISQCEAFLNAYGLSRFAPYPYDPASLPIRDLAGYRKGGSDDEKMTFYTFPAAFEGEIAEGFNPKQFAEILKNAGMLTPPAKGRGYQRKSPRINGRQVNVYVLSYLPASEEGELIST